MNKTVAVAFLLSLGFAKAKGWDDEKMVKFLKQSANRLTDDMVASADVDTLHKLKAAGEDIEIIEDAVKTDKVADKPVEKKTAVASKPKEPKAEKKEAKVKAEKVTKPKAEKDEYGATVDTNQARVNKAVSEKWQTCEELAEKSGVAEFATLMSVRKLLKTHSKQFEKRRRIEYRFIPTDK